MFLEIISPEKTLYSSKIFSVQLPAYEGSLQVLPNHAPMLCTLKKGKIVVKEKKDSKSQSFDIEDGLVQVSDNKTLVLLNKVL